MTSKVPETTETVEQVAPRGLILRPQLREDVEVTIDAGFVETIRRFGVLQPVVARREGDVLIVIAGERRVRGAILANLPTIPVLVSNKPLEPAEVLECQLVENLQRCELPLLQLAKGIKQLMDSAGCSATQAAQWIGKSPATVTKVLSLLTLPPALQARIATGDIGLAEGYRLSRISEPASQAEPAGSARPPQKASQPRGRFTAMLDGVRSIAAVGIEATLDGFQLALEDLLARTRQARKQKLQLPTFLKSLKDKAQFDQDGGAN